MRPSRGLEQPRRIVLLRLPTWDRGLRVERLGNESMVRLDHRQPDPHEHDEDAKPTTGAILGQFARRDRIHDHANKRRCAHEVWRQGEQEEHLAPERLAQL